MKITGASPYTNPIERRRVTANGSVSPAAGGVVRADNVAFLGVPPVELTPAVQTAFRSLLADLDDLRGEIAQLRARLSVAEGLADRDTLTPLLNRRAFVRELGRLSAFAERHGSPASLIYFDLDGFKGLNDRQGHAAGDAALRAVADRLSAGVRESDLVGRMGGDEFAVALVHADRAAAEDRAAELADSVEGHPTVAAFGTLRLSYGVGAIAPGADPEALIAEADTAMFAAKRQRKAG